VSRTLEQVGVPRGNILVGHFRLFLSAGLKKERGHEAEFFKLLKGTINVKHPTVSAIRRQPKH
jgi:hypothetical protein